LYSGDLATCILTLILFAGRIATVILLLISSVSALRITLVGAIIVIHDGKGENK
jgi:hypothetical protein